MVAAYGEEKVARPFKAEMDSSKPGHFSGLAAVFGDLHPTSTYALPRDWQDKISPGAFQKTLDEHKRAGTMPTLLYMHDRGNVVGVWHELGETGSGLHGQGQVSLEARTPSGAPLHELMKMGGLNSLSIGFRVLKSELDEKKKIRDIKEVKLGEVSLVDIPGINRARVTDVKSLGPQVLEAIEALREGRDRLDPRFLEAMCRRMLGFSRSESKALLAGGLPALRDAVEKKRPRDADSASGEVLEALRRLAKDVKPKDDDDDDDDDKASSEACAGCLEDQAEGCECDGETCEGCECEGCTLEK